MILLLTKCIKNIRSIESISQGSQVKLLLEKLTPSKNYLLSVNDNIFIDLTSFYKPSLSNKISILKEAISNNLEVCFNYFSSKYFKSIYMNLTYSCQLPNVMIEINRKGAIKMTNELLKKTENFILKTETGILSSIDEDGYPRTAAMCSLKTDGINTIWFSTGTNSHKVANFKRNPKASVCYFNAENNVTLTGDITIVDDMKIKTELWVDWFIKHYPLGIEDPNYCILKFETNYIQAYIDDEFEDLILKK